MDTTDLYAEITHKIITVQQLRQALDLLRQTNDLLYKNGIDVKDTLEKTLPYYLAETLFSMADNKQINLTDLAQVQELIKNLIMYLEKVTIAELVIAYIPTYRNIQEIADWWAKYTGRHVVIALKIDETIISGAQVSYEGVYKDYTLATWISQNAVGDLDQFN